MSGLFLCIIGFDDYQEYVVCLECVFDSFMFEDQCRVCFQCDFGQFCGCVVFDCVQIDGRQVYVLFLYWFGYFCQYIIVLFGCFLDFCVQVDQLVEYGIGVFLGFYGEDQFVCDYSVLVDIECFYFVGNFICFGDVVVMWFVMWCINFVIQGGCEG